MLKNLTKLGKDTFNFKSKISILHNKPLLYAFFIIALIQLVYLLQSGNFYFAAVLLLIAVITRYFSKNMLVIICVALAATNVLMLGPKASHSIVEGFEDDEEVEEMEEDEGEDDESSDISGNKPTTTPEPDMPSEGLNNAEESKDLNLALNAENRLKESFNKVDLYDKNSVMDYEKNSDRVILAQEKMLSSINQYKPLLDTINSISKNLSFFNNVKTE